MPEPRRTLRSALPPAPAAALSLLTALTLGGCVPAAQDPGQTPTGPTPNGQAAAPSGQTTAPAVPNASETAEPSGTGPADTPEALVAAVRQDALREDLEAIERIARENGGHRASGTPGADATVEYVVAELEEAGYEVQLQPFEGTYRENTAHAFTLRGPAPRSLDYTVLRYSPAITAQNAPLRAPAVADGCSSADWGGADLTGAIALVSVAGDCSLSTKSAVARSAGAVGVVVYNDADGPLYASLGYPHEDHAGTVAVSGELGRDLLAAARTGQARVDLRVDEKVEQRTFVNVLAEAPGRSQDAVLVGAHLDSVPFGPGIHDNATGVAAVLEIARRAAGSGPHEHPVRFALWSAEEIGLQGSRHYVDALTDAEAQRIALYVNVDMVAPVDTDDPVRVLADSGRPGAERLLADQLRRDGETTAVTESTGWSDFGPFRWADIPATGLFSEDDAANHTPDDGPQNVSVERLERSTRALGHLVGVLRDDASALTAR
ncbi:M20/M25/M40 family metallo-hydrolase [Micrococcus sp.]|uniref:M20/M25/M40 family metallo-hydrolase n=1 Tax=Micrococcus sp. TaxID=1271 RepID=UPI002A91F182|nr:M20/M25/M40 family metallo-hydrolase [Micrococcus sp.]MDY6055267.1 M20/M25/M40 family metallo-hydrolase [Micrococcus sp.]